MSLSKYPYQLQVFRAGAWAVHSEAASEESVRRKLKAASKIASEELRWKRRGDDGYIFRQACFSGWL